MASALNRLTDAARSFFIGDAVAQNIGVTDGLENAMAGIGTPRDKSSANVFVMTKLTDQEITAAYRSTWLARKIVDIPAQDATRRWRAWNAEKSQISAIEAEENRLGLSRTVRDALIAARLFGGSAIYLFTGDSDVSQPLDPERVGKAGIKHLTVLSRHDLLAGGIEKDPESPNFGRPSHYQINGGSKSTMRIDPSRLVIFQGAPSAAGVEMSDAAGWGDSVLQSVGDAVKQAESVAANAASLIFEANVDVIHLPGLMEMVSTPEGENRVGKYLRTLALGKGINGMLVLDGGKTIDNKVSNKTEYDRKGAQFAGVASIWDRAMQVAAGAADIPATRLFGMSPAGQNATGESDMQNYAQRIGAIQSMDIGPAMALLDECLIRSALGTRPPEIYYDWRSIMETSPKERAENGKIIADIIAQMVGTGLFLPEVLAEAGSTAMIETGAVPGLEAAIDEHGLDTTAPVNEGGAASIASVMAADAEPKTLYVSRPVVNAEEIISWAKSQGFKSTLPASDLHVTIAYSRSPVDWMAVGQDWSEELKVGEGGPRIMEAFGDAQVLLFSSEELDWRHKRIINAGATWDYPEYQPHITIGYSNDIDLSQVEPYSGRIIFGPEVFSEINEDWQSKVQEF